jgi:hypothetical protein
MANVIVTMSVLQLLLLLAMSPAHVSSDPVPVIFYPFGTNQGDAVASTNDDGFTSGISITGIGFPFFGSNQQKVFVSRR